MPIASSKSLDINKNKRKTYGEKISICWHTHIIHCIVAAKGKITQKE